MTNWFKKLGIPEKEITDVMIKKNILDAISQTKVKHLDDMDVLIVVGLSKYDDYYDVKRFFCTPFCIHEHIEHPIVQDKSGFRKYLNDKERDDWTAKIKSKDFSSTPQEYYDLFLSKCSDEDKTKYVKELDEEYRKCVKEEIALLEEKVNEIKTEFDKEIIARKQILNVGMKKGQYGSKVAGKGSSDKYILNPNNPHDIKARDEAQYIDDFENE